MKIENYEFGWVRPLKWDKYRREDLSALCGCVIWSWGFWYLTRLAPDCYETDTPITIDLPKAVNGRKLVITNEGHRPIVIQGPSRQEIILPPEGRYETTQKVNKKKKRRKKRRSKKSW